MTPTLTLLCGLPGSGKTTLARQLEARSERGGQTLRLSSDDWMVPLFGQHMPREVFDARLAVIRDLQWELAARLLRLELNVVLDEGFWRLAERDLYRQRARELGASCQIVFLDVPLPELQRRLEARNAAAEAGTFLIDAAGLALFESWFERPNTDEPGVIVDLAVVRAPHEEGLEP
ncbi:AAA family ATPase [Deinococcus sp. QL22]|uniref:AAA family ATPase n=1 Tax=Deinococcus sp. QL22 TaxID=2939437 RepID=UPI002016F32E|nr:AAA family ATPase [Deinococcus sp. QL22]UQN05169.1 AAA family ATPase [Deinococcus sp. QL22]